ncbi:Poly [ADP-ribose] polymerase, partial [Fusarium oxysporum f. sp. albedinis]
MARARRAPLSQQIRWFNSLHSTGTGQMHASPLDVDWSDAMWTVFVCRRANDTCRQRAVLPHPYSSN